MEEKERFELFGEHCIKDNNPDARCQLLNAYVACVILNEQDKENQQLKQKLAESEKNFIIANNLRKNSNEVLLNYKTEKYGLDKTIQELRKIKLSFPEKEWYYKGFENCERQMSSHIADLTLEVKQLKQQLARTEKALELAVGQLDDAKDMLIECGKHDWAGMIDTSVDYFKARAREMLENDTSL